MCNSSPTPIEKEENNNVAEVNQSSGFHFIEFHMPSIGAGVIIVIIIITALIGIVYFCKKCRRGERSVFTQSVQQYPIPMNPMQTLPMPMIPQLMPQMMMMNPMNYYPPLQQRTRNTNTPSHNDDTDDRFTEMNSRSPPPQTGNNITAIVQND